MPTKLLLLLPALCLSYTFTFGQAAFEWQATVAAPTKPGYYKILLPPSVTGRLRPDLADIRVYNASQQEVPYLLRQEEKQYVNQTFNPYNILHYSHQVNCCSELLIENPSQRQISNLSLLIKNADVQKQVSLSGSNDRQNWYVLKANDVLHTINSTESTAKLKLLEFPLNDYRYLRLLLNDSSSAPLNILQAGYYSTQTGKGKYTVIPVQQTTRTDSASTKQTFIKLTFAHPIYPELLEMDITAPALYQRQGWVKFDVPEAKQLGRRTRRTATAPANQVQFTLQSNKPTSIGLPRQQVQELTLVIANEDNQPLEITDVKVLQLNRYLIANLDEGVKYTLHFGSATATPPTYDLQYFRDSIPANVPVLAVNNVTTVSRDLQPKEQLPRVLIWAAIGVVVFGLGYMTVKLLNEMNQEQKQA